MLRRCTRASVRIRRDIYHILRVWTQVSQRIIGRPNNALNFLLARRSWKEMDGVGDDGGGVVGRSILPRDEDR